VHLLLRRRQNEDDALFQLGPGDAGATIQLYSAEFRRAAIAGDHGKALAYADAWERLDEQTST
jgi:hypothetical protein